jgi:hypothetical protein
MEMEIARCYGESSLFGGIGIHCKRLGFSDRNRERAFGDSKALCWNSLDFFSEVEDAPPMLLIFTSWRREDDLDETLTLFFY